MESLAERLAWRGEPGPLIVENDTVLIETAIEASSPLARAWSRLKRHWNLLQTAGASKRGMLTLHYAALDPSPELARPMTWGLDILRALDLIRTLLPSDALVHFAHPRAHVALDGHVRLRFVEGPPRGFKEQPQLVAWVRETLAQLAPCDLDGVNLRELRLAYMAAGGNPHAPSDQATRRWVRFERAASWLAAGDPHRAGTESLTLRGEPHQGPLFVAAAERVPSLITPSTAHLVSPEAVRRRADELPPREAMVLLSTLGWLGDAQLLALAHRAIAAGDLRYVPFERLLAHNPNDLALLRGRAIQLLHARDAAAARNHIEHWLSLAPDDPAAHAMLGNALQLLGHPEKARAAHDVAANKGYLPSQFARTNLDRAVKRLASVAGTQGYRDLPVPEHLRDVVPLLSQGRLLDAILWLTDRYADPEARALLASCYEYAGDTDSALHVHEQDGNLAGIARCLLALGRRDEAFARVGDDPALLDELRELAGLPAERIAWTR